MEMTKREYAEVIAKKVAGEVKEVEKTNGVIMTGIMITNDTNITPTFYIDEMYEKDVPANEAAGLIMEQIENGERPQFDISAISSWDSAKEMLRIRLYNKKTTAPIKRSARSYGFSDLIMVPVIEFDDNASAKVTKALAKQWGKSAKTIIDTALLNTKEKEKFEIIEMAEMLAEMMGVPVEMLRKDAPPIWVISNEQRINGAVGIIILADKLKEMYPNGYYILPSSIHEALVIDVSFCDDPDILTSMVQDVNGACLRPEEVLGDKAYIREG